MIPYKCNDKWGFSDLTGSEIIPAQYDTVSLYSEGYSVVGIKDKYGVIDSIGNEILAIEFDKLTNYNSLNDCIRGKKRGKWGVYNKKGKRIRKRTFRSHRTYGCMSTSPTNAGHSKVFLYELNGKYGFIRYSCSNIKQDSCKEYQPTNFDDFIELGLSIIGLKTENYWMVYSYDGQKVSQEKYDMIYNDLIGREKMQYYKVESSGKVGLIKQKRQTCSETYL